MGRVGGLGIDPHVLNDDRVGRALDAVAPELDQIVGSVGAPAIGVFGLDVARLHWDITSIWLYGADPDPDGGFPTPRCGHPKDRRPDLKQVQTDLVPEYEELGVLGRLAAAEQCEPADELPEDHVQQSQRFHGW